MNWPYIHILINHFPIVLSIVGTAVLLLALIVRQRAYWLYALATLTLAGLSIGPVYISGDQAGDAVRNANTWYIVRAAVDEHDAAAMFALISVLAVGVVSAYTWWRMLRRETMGLPPTWLRTVVAVVAVWSVSVVARTAYLGGKIVHESPKLVTPPSGLATSPGRAP